MKLLIKRIFENTPFQEYSPGEKYQDISSYLFKVTFHHQREREIMINNKRILTKDQEYIFLAYPTEEKPSLLRVMEKGIVQKEYFLSNFKHRGLDGNFLKMLENFRKNHLEEFLKNEMEPIEGLFEKNISPLETLEIHEEELIASLKEVTRVIAKILVFPKLALEDAEEIVDTSNLKKISRKTMDYFVKSSQYWHRERFEKPKPMKLLQETFKETKDNYENRFVVYFIKNCQELVEYRIYLLQRQLEKHRNQLADIHQSLEVEGEFQTHQEIEFLRRSKDLKEREVKEILAYISSYEGLGRELHSFKRNLQEVKVIPNLKVKMTQQILYDKRYLQLFHLYKILKQHFLIQEEGGTAQYINHHQDYMFMILAVLQGILQKTFYRREGIEGQGQLFSNNNQEMIFTYYLNVDPNIQVIVRAFPLNSPHENRHGKIHLTLWNKKKDEKREILLHPYLTSIKEINQDLLQEIRGIYNLLSQQEGTNLVLYNLSLTKLSNVKVRMKDHYYQILSYLSNVGSNFITKEDYDAFGGFKAGFLPCDFENLVYQMNKLKGIINRFLLELEGQEFCLHCTSNQVKLEGGVYRCVACRRRWVIHDCSNPNCDGKIIKFLYQYEGESPQGDVEIRQNFKELAEYYNQYEIKSKFIGACFQRFYDNKGGYCPKCGEGQGSCPHKNCLRCGERSKNNGSNISLI